MQTSTTPGEHTTLARGELESVRSRLAELERDFQELSRKEAHLRDLVSASPVVIYTCQPSGNYAVTYMSDNVFRHFGYTADEFTADPSFWADRIHPDDIERVFRSLEKLSGEGYTTHEYRFRHKDGRWLWAHDDVALSRNADGQVIELVGYWQDVTDRVVADQKLRQQAETLRELSTPLIPISDRVVAMPLIGVMDSHRAQQVLTTLLDGIGRTSAAVAIIDITGVALVDTHVASALIQSAKAAQLMGAQVVITGIRPEVAQILVALQLDLGGIVTRGNLQSGIAYARSVADAAGRS